RAPRPPRQGLSSDSAAPAPAPVQPRSPPPSDHPRPHHHSPTSYSSQQRPHEVLGQKHGEQQEQIEQRKAEQLPGGVVSLASFTYAIHLDRQRHERNAQRHRRGEINNATKPDKRWNHRDDREHDAV